MSALNVMKWESRRITQSETSQRCSVASVKIRKFNEYLLKRFSDMSGIDLSLIKYADAYRQIIKSRSYRCMKTVRTIDFYENKTSAQVKKCFFNFLSEQFFNFDKLKWYLP
ncbi:MAG: hypothetical protein HC887_10295 [Desulfobacteraceae bacterium]|nr:hypothetical protein [Desulfobacteraceae bacterium]